MSLVTATGTQNYTVDTTADTFYVMFPARNTSNAPTLNTLPLVFTQNNSTILANEITVGELYLVRKTSSNYQILSGVLRGGVADNGHIRSSNGILECWRTATGTVGGTAWSNVNTVWYSRTSMGNWTYPFTDIDTSATYVSVSSCWFNSHGMTTTNAGEMWTFRPNNSAQAGTIMKIRGFGFWK